MRKGCWRELVMLKDSVQRTNLAIENSRRIIENARQANKSLAMKSFNLPQLPKYHLTMIDHEPHRGLK
jgi:hypothetical protein